LVFTAEKCISCGECAQVCAVKATRFDRAPRIDWKLCRSCFACVEACPAVAREAAGREFSAEALTKEVLKDREFFGADGGVTLSGGEPFSQAKFLAGFLPLLKKEKIHVTVETCGHFNWEPVAPLMKMVDLILFDFKAVHPQLHEKITGKDNQLILKNLRKILDLKIPHQIRMPLAPGFNDSEEELAAAAQYLRDELHEPELWLIPYHRLGESKLKKLFTGLKPLGLSSMSEKDLRVKAEFIAAHGIAVRTFNFSVEAKATKNT